ncbi:glycosyltransferase [Curtobacterium sp. MCSS17_007]|uniref:glycosyltransferase n=1 Tax=Curtobacterium sp. MCSS17_007 TaxID=2175646 RepID=UPI000DA70397|nr:glycosyltransferase [Curtobacterium sp. MCSS17_007]WIE76142.1 glycosyltransferase [Curtobacterium sp. MCSS17_007]
MSDLSVGVFRHTHGRLSEQFIEGQALAFQRYRPVLLSRDDVQSERSQIRTFRSSYPIVSLAYRAGLRGAVGGFLADAQVDVLHAHFGVEGAFVRKAAHARRLPLVVTLHGYDVLLSDSALRRSGKPALLAYSIWRRELFADGDVQFIAVSKFLASRAAEHGLDPARVQVIPTGIDTSVLKPTALPEEPRIVHVARLVDFKGTEDLLSAFDLVRKRLPSVTLDIVGDGPLRGHLEAHSRALGLQHVVTFHGALPHAQTIGFIERARVLCLPSRSVEDGGTEGLGQVSLEAMALGRLVVASETGGIPEVISNGKDGLLVPERSAGALAEALVHALDGDGIGELAERGRRKVEEQFDVRRQAALVENVYDKARGA